MESRLSDRKLKPLPPDPFRHQNSAIALDYVIESPNVSGDDHALLFLTLSVSLFKSKNRLAAENAALRHQLIVLQRRVRGRVRLTNGELVLGPAISMVSIGPQGHHDHPARDPRALGAITSQPVLGGLHHQYCRI